MNKKMLGFAAAAVLLAVSNAFMTAQALFLKKEVASLEKSLEEFKEKIEEEIINLAAREEENKAEIKDDLAALGRKSEAQFSKTVGMSRTYEAILEEQKKKTVDTAEKDEAYLAAKKEAVSLYKKGAFYPACEEFKKLSEEREDDMECRLFLAKSMFYMNRADSSNYAAILENIKALKQNAAADDECLDIEKSILAEQEGIHE